MAGIKLTCLLLMFERARFPLPQRNLTSVERDGRSGTREDEKGRFSQTPRLISFNNDTEGSLYDDDDEWPAFG